MNLEATITIVLDDGSNVRVHAEGPVTRQRLGVLGVLQQLLDGITDTAPAAAPVEPAHTSQTNPEPGPRHAQPTRSATTPGADQPEPEFVCDVCNKPCATAGGLGIHRARKHRSQASIPPALAVVAPRPSPDGLALRCGADECDADYAVTEISKLRHHTSAVHHRPPTTAERTPRTVEDLIPGGGVGA